MSEAAEGEAIRARLQPLLASAAEVIIARPGDPTAAVPFGLSRLRTEADVADEFRSNASKHLNQIAAHDVIPFDYGHSPDEGESMDLKVANFDYPDLVDKLLVPDSLPVFDPGDEDDVAFYCVRFRKGDMSVGFLKQVNAVQLGKRNWIATALLGDRIAKLEAEVLTFAPGVDIVLEPLALLVANASAFRGLFRGADAVAAAVSKQVEKLTASVPIANAGDFEQACRRDPKMMSKLARVMKKPYLPSMTPQVLRRLVKDYKLPPDLVTADGKLVHDSSPQRRWLILRILDDAYVESGVTKLRYAANSKRQL